MPKRTVLTVLVVPAFVSLLAVLLAQQAASASRRSAEAATLDSREGFSFMEGRWRVHNRRLKESLTEREDWTEFEANLVCVSVLSGLVNIDEMRQADGTPMGSAVRVFDTTKRTWSDYWIRASDGVLTDPVIGKFAKGRGEFVGPDTYKGKKVLVRYVWTELASKPRWEQAISADGGKTWQVNWIMVYERLPEPGILPWPTDWRVTPE